MYNKCLTKMKNDDDDDGSGGGELMRRLWYYVLAGSYSCHCSLKKYSSPIKNIVAVDNTAIQSINYSIKVSSWSVEQHLQLNLCINIYKNIY